ncbi:MAG: hypothetical protein WB217_04115 [Mesobacillus sp.]|uniref:hypothetical protein n=1 Tax=Mesobacillus sp. TaxID=2675271 RepID=UPI003C523F47
MKRLVILNLIFSVLMVGCSPEKQSKITRIDVQVDLSQGSKNDEVRMIVDQESIRAVEQALHDIKWEANTNASMARKEDLLATFFIMEDKNMPERLYEYRIWFDGGTATLISNHPNEGYGRLFNEEDLQVLQKEFMNER